MSQNESDGPASGQPEKPQGPPPTPFDHPLFLPVLLFAGVLWFGYDGWIETAPEMVEHQTFNRVGFAVLLVLSAWFGYKGIREFKEDRAAARDARAAGSDPPAHTPTD